MKLSMLRAVLFAVVGVLCVAPAARPQFQPACRCVGVQYPQIFADDCLSQLALTTSLSDGQCPLPGCVELPCYYTASVYWRVKQSCGGGAYSETISGNLPCKGFLNHPWYYNANLVALAVFQCIDCP